MTDKLTKAICHKIAENYHHYQEIPKVDDIDELHDIACLAQINGVIVEEDDVEYEKMIQIIDKNSEQMITKIKKFMNELPNYYQDPAFVSEGHYWATIMR